MQNVMFFKKNAIVKLELIVMMQSQASGDKTQVQLAMTVGQTLRVIIAAGKFHGVIATTIPVGCWWDIYFIRCTICSVSYAYSNSDVSDYW